MYLPGNYLPLPPRVFTSKTFLTPQHRPPLGVLRVLTRTLKRCMLFSAIAGYCSSLNYYSRVYKETFVLNTWPPPQESATDCN